MGIVDVSMGIASSRSDEWIFFSADVSMGIADVSMGIASSAST